MVRQGDQRRKGGRFARSNNKSTQFSKKIGALNRSGNLVTEIKFTEVKELLTAIGEEQAMRILGDVEQQGAAIPDPTTYVLTEASQCEQLPPDQQKHTTPQSERRQPRQPRNVNNNSDWSGMLAERVQHMNDTAGLAQELVLDQILPKAMDAGEAATMEILSTLEQSAGEVRDPTRWTMAQLDKQTKQKQNKNGGRQNNGGQNGRIVGAVSAAPRQPRQAPLLPPPAAAGGNAGEEAKLLKRVCWLNDHVTFATPLEYEKVSQALLKIGYFPALEVLNNLEEMGAEVRDPNGFVISSARKMGKNLSKTGGAPAPIAPVAPSAAPRTIVGGGGRIAPQSQMLMPQQQSNAGQPRMNQKLVRRVNNLVQRLGVPLEWDRISASITSVPVHVAMEILSRFEPMAAEIRNPSAWVNAQVRKAGSGAPAPVGNNTVGGRQLVGMSMEAPRGQKRNIAAIGSTPINAFGSRVGQQQQQNQNQNKRQRTNQEPQQKAELDDAVRERVETLSVPVDINKVAGPLARMDRDAGLALLQKVEEMGAEIRDANGFIISHSRPRRVRNGNKNGSNIAMQN